jgi:hypothetical protein
MSCRFNSGVLDIEVAMGGSWDGSSIMIAISSLGFSSYESDTYQSAICPVPDLKRMFDRNQDVGLKRYAAAS